MILAFAGRRVDPEGQDPPRFSSSVESVARVRALIHNTFVCGADLLALEQAGILGLRRRIILPFDRDRFRSTSVTDRPGPWGELYDTVLDDVQARGNLVIAPTVAKNKTYIETNHLIVEEALSLAKALHQPTAAIRVWEGAPRGKEDFTEEFGEYAQRRGLQVHDVPTQ